jgi:class 3 adenylate cyclase/tetratricopeptide (TPR) repeat protein
VGLVTCHSCGAGAQADQRFCGDCGTPLATGCPNCGATNQPGQRFCGACGTRLDGAAAGSATTGAQSAAGVSAAAAGNGVDTTGVAGAMGMAGGSTQPVAERRLVSVLFADLVGFTPFSEERDSEDVRETLTKYFDLATAIITRYGGTVEKFIGDAVMAVWGTPTTREDDAERAVRAAMDLVGDVADLGPGIQARAGVLTGETAVTLGAQNQGMVAGDLVNTAARLQAAAAPGTVLVGESTYRAASVAIAFEPAGEQTLKGKAAPVQAWRALRVVAERGGRGRADQLEPPFVGRDVELRLLKDLFHACGAERRVRHVSVVGTAGIGKSRLAWEFEKYLDGIHELVLWNHGRSPAYGQGITFWSLGEMIRRRAGLAETDDQNTTRERITAMLDDIMPGHQNRAWVERSMLQLLGVAGGVSSAELFGAWRAFFESLSQRGTVVLVFQDVHWADSGTLDFIDHLVEWSREFPIYILSLARPEILEERPEWGAARRSFTTVYLEPISEASMRELLTGLVPDLPETTVKSIVSQAEGVPLFAVEIIRMLINTGQLVPAEDGTFHFSGDVAEIAVPETLTALIGARLDALDAGDRALLLDAAVLGQSFTPEGLAAVSGRSAAEIEPRLRALTRRELLRLVVDERSPERGQYAFVQALVRETAYNTLARKDRQTRHLAAARWFETLGEPELVGALAGHFLAARSLAPAGPEADALAAQARLALKAAGDRAASLGSNRQAAEFYAQALSVTVEDADEAAICEVAADVAQTLTNYDVAHELLSRALEIHRARDDRDAAARVTATLGEVLLNARRMDDALRVLRDGTSEFADLGDSRPVLHMKSQQARHQMLSQEYDAVLPLTDEVLKAVERSDDLPLLTDTLVTRGTAIAGLLRWREGATVLFAAQEMAKANGYNAMLLRAINNYMVYGMNVDPHESLAAINEGLHLARRLGYESSVQGFAGLLALVGRRTGSWDEVLASVDATMASATDPRTRSVSLEDIATIRAFRGEPIEAYLAEVEATAALDGGDTMRKIAVAVMAVQHFAAGRLDEARRLWAGLALEDPTYARSYAALPARTAIWVADIEAAAHLQAIHWAAVSHGGAHEIDHLSLTSAIQGLRGESAAAAAGYRDAMRRYRELRLDLDLGLMAIDMVYVLGPDDPPTQEAVDAARTTFTKERARTFLDQLDIALAHGAHPTDGRSAADRSARKAGVPAT